MQTYSQLSRVLISIICASVSILFISFFFNQTPTVFSQSSIADDLVYKELVAIYETNLIRRENGLGPLRWNKELSLAARDFAKDTIAVRDTPYCGHTDSLGRSSGDRIEATGYRLVRWAENAACGYLEPEVAVPSWYQSESHRRNMLIPDLREIGVGYYVDAQTERGYVVQDFAFDGIGAPIVINNEAPATESTEVSLYIYDNVQRSGFNGIDSAVEMMISNDPYFENAEWEPYTTEKNWFLETGTGWRTVYVKTRDNIGRVTMSYDMIYLGSDLPIHQLSLDHASTIQSQLSGAALVKQFPQAADWASIQVGRYWAIDDSSDSFSLFRDSGSQVSDPDAHGGTAYRLTLSRYDASFLGDNATLAAAWVGDALPNTPLFAYARVKVASNRTSDRLLKIWAESGETAFEPIILKSNDFAGSEVYQDIAIPVEFSNPAQGDLLAIHFYHYGGIEVSIDTVSFFTAEQVFDQSFQWNTSDPLQRDRGFVIRVLPDSNSSTDVLLEVGQRPVTVADTNPPVPQETAEAATPTPVPTPLPGQPGIVLSSNSLEFSAQVGGTSPDLVNLDVDCTGCEEHAWWVYSNSSWLQAFRFFNDLHVQVNQTGLAPGVYEGLATLGAPSASGIPIQQISVRFVVTAASAPATATPMPTATPRPTARPTATPLATATSTPQVSPPVPTNPGKPTPVPSPTPQASIVVGELTNSVYLPLTSR